MDTTILRPIQILILMAIVGGVAMAIPIESSNVGVMTPFHRTLSGMYGQ